MQKKKNRTIPNIRELETELQKEQYKMKFRQVFRSTFYTLITVAAVAVLVAVLLLPVLRIYGHSMTPGLEDGDIVVAVKGAAFETGDVISFYYNNKILVKRVIAGPGDWVDIEENGDVYINQKKIEEPYITEKALGECDIEFPYQVPDSRFFVMGDHRNVSVDSRNTAVGCVAEDQIVGKLIFKIWPLKEIGSIR